MSPVAAADPRDGVSRAALDQELARLNTAIRDAIPEDPDDPDDVFSSAFPGGG